MSKQIVPFLNGEVFALVIELCVNRLLPIGNVTAVEDGIESVIAVADAELLKSGGHA